MIISEIYKAQIPAFMGYFISVIVKDKFKVAQNIFQDVDFDGSLQPLFSN